MESKPKEEPFKARIARVTELRRTRIILALDVEGKSPDRLFNKSKRLLKETEPYICGLKVGRGTVLNIGTERTSHLLQLASDHGIPTIIDDKLNDIDETNRQIASAYFRIGFDAIIVNPFVGWKGGLEPVFQLAHQLKRGVIALVYMSHPGAEESYGQRVHIGPRIAKPQYRIFSEKAVKWKADGVVVGATRPQIVMEIKTIVNGIVPIYSPGIGIQRGKLKAALEAGTDYFIIGRSITRASKAAKAAAKYAKDSMSLRD